MKIMFIFMNTIFMSAYTQYFTMYIIFLLDLEKLSRSILEQYKNINFWLLF